MNGEKLSMQARYPPDELESRAGDLARQWAEGEGAGLAEIELAESVIRWVAGVVQPVDPVGPDLARRLDEFAQMVVHELRNPLSQVQIGLEMLSQRRAAEGGEDDVYLGWMERGVARVVETLDDLRVLALAEMTSPGARWAPIRKVVENVFNRLEEEASRREVVCTADGVLPDATVDAAQVGMALGNLVGNAVKYADPEKDERWVRVKVKRVTGVIDGWRFTVADNGRGIPARLQRDVFRRHFRAHPEVSEGMGLGLAITRQVIERRNGQVWFHSEEGKGSIFHFVVPDAALPEGARLPASGAPDTAPATGPVLDGGS